MGAGGSNQCQAIPVPTHCHLFREVSEMGRDKPGQLQCGTLTSEGRAWAGYMRAGGGGSGGGGGACLESVWMSSHVGEGGRSVVEE